MSDLDYLSLLNDSQKEAVIHEGGSLLILAGAGSGKTRVITTKIAYLISEKGLNARNILAVTFTKKAASEMAERARLLEPLAQYTHIRTFHSFGSWFLRLYGEEIGLNNNFTVYDDDDMVTLLTKAIPTLTKMEAKHTAHLISRAKDYCYTPDSPELIDFTGDLEFPSLYTAYQERLKETGNVDFGDLIMLPYIILRDNPKIREQINYRFKIIMVDEYQDSNVAQFLLLQQLSGPNTYVCVVGDDDQSIYKFRGAEVKNILSFQDQFPHTTLIKLESNYRSTASILQVADDVVKNNSGRLGKTLFAERGDGKKPQLLFLENQDMETAFCAEMIQLAYHNGVPYSDWAILYRTNAQSLGFETEFLHKRIPYTVVGALKFYEREEIKDIIAYISFLANQKDEIAFRRIVNKPARGIGSVSQDKIVDFTRNNYKYSESFLLSGDITLLDGARGSLKNLSKKTQTGLQAFLDIMEELAQDIGLSQDIPALITEEHESQKNEEEQILNKDTPRLSTFIEKIAKKSGLIEYHSMQDEISGTQRVANMQELANSAVVYPFSRIGLIEFLDHIELDRTLETETTEEKSRDAVTLITLHNTKGLEFPRVVMTGLENGIFPRSDKDEEEIEEERRLFYVGATRAKDELYITACNQRRMYGKTDPMQPSKFLFEINKDSIDTKGQIPKSFKNHLQAVIGNPKEVSQKSELALKWKKGTKLFHDDWGYGYVISTRGDDDIESDDENFVISVQFETGSIKQFMPKYQAHSLMIIKD